MGAPATAARVVEIARACGERLDRGLEWIPLTLGRRRVRGRRVRLAGPCSPLGELACVNAAGDIVAHFRAIDVLAWCCAHGVVRVVARVVAAKAPSSEE